MANYAFYKNVIDQTYKYQGKECQLHTILGSLINEKSITIDKILPLFQMFKYYEKLSFVAGKRRDELFNIKNQQEFLVGLGSNANFVKSLVSYINNAFCQLPLCVDADDRAKKLKGLKEVIRMGTQFHEREMFILYYKKSLSTRLLENANTDLDAEKESLLMFKENKSDNRNVQKMYDMVKDIEEFRLNKKYIVKLEVKVTQVTQDKYEAVGLDITKFDKRKANIIPLAFGVWDLSLVENNGNYNVPLELQYYLDIFNAYYTKRYQHRKLTYDFNNGVATISITLGGVKYTIEMTTPQLFLMYQFNHTPEINAKDLAKNLGMTLKQLTPVLNSLIKCGLIDRQAGERTDPNLKFFVNTKFKSSQKEFSITSFMNQGKAEETDKEIQEQFAHKREDIVKCVLVRILKHSKEMTVEALFEACSKQLSIFQLTAPLFKTALTTAIKDEYVVQTVKDNVKYYQYMDKADSDDEFEDDADESKN
jgi:DNA-binding MarR family transcriptional regulator